MWLLTVNMLYAWLGVAFTDESVRQKWCFSESRLNIEHLFSDGGRSGTSRTCVGTESKVCWPWIQHFLNRLSLKTQSFDLIFNSRTTSSGNMESTFGGLNLFDSNLRTLVIDWNQSCLWVEQYRNCRTPFLLKILKTAWWSILMTKREFRVMHMPRLFLLLLFISAFLIICREIVQTFDVSIWATCIRVCPAIFISI